MVEGRHGVEQYQCKTKYCEAGNDPWVAFLDTNCEQGAQANQRKYSTNQMADVCAARNSRLFAAVPLRNENHIILNGSFRTTAPTDGVTPIPA